MAAPEMLPAIDHAVAGPPWLACDPASSDSDTAGSSATPCDIRACLVSIVTLRWLSFKDRLAIPR